MSLSIHVYVWRVYFYVIFVSVCVYTEVLCQGDRTTFDVHIWWHLLVSQAERLKRDQQNTIVNQTISWTKSFLVLAIVFEAMSRLTLLAMDMLTSLALSMLTSLTLTVMALNMLTSGRDKNCGDEEKRAKGGESRTTTRTTRKQANKATFRALELSVYGLLVLSLSSKLIAGPSTR